MIEKYCSEAVEERTVVRVCRRLMKVSRVKVLVFQAVKKPPREPAAFTYWMVFVKCGGRKLCALKRLTSRSLVSWRQITAGAAETRASLTTAHLSGSPNPRTFHDTI